MTTELGIIDMVVDLCKTTALNVSRPFVDVRALAKKLPGRFDVPDFANDMELLAWLNDNHLSMNFSKGHMDLRLCKPVLSAYVGFAKQYPEMALRNHVGTYNGESAVFAIANAMFENRPAGGIGFSASTFIPNMGIYLNEVYFGDADKLYSLYEGWERERWFPRACGHGVESLVTHELSHQLYAALSREERDGWMAFINKHPDERRIVSGYAMSMPRECFCEAFTASIYGDYENSIIIDRAAEPARRFQFNS